MARQSRNAVAGVAHLVMQRGHNGSVLFRHADDREFLRETVLEASRTEQLRIHAYALTDEALLFLLRPHQAQSLSRFMQAIGRRYARYVNARYQRSGSLYDGRYRCALIEDGESLMRVMLYLDSLVASEYGSSMFYLGLHPDRLLTAPAMYWQLGNTPYARESAYQQLLRTGLNAQQHSFIAQQLMKNHAYGSDDFINRMEEVTGLRLRASKPGRPRKSQTLK
jgi:putative transposase